MGNIIVVVLILVWAYTAYTKKQKQKDGALNPGTPRPPVNASYNQGRPPVNASYNQGRPPVNGNYNQSRPPVNGNYNQSRPPVNGNYNQGRPPVNGNDPRNMPGNAGGGRVSGNAAAQQQLKSRLQQKYAGRPFSAYSQQRTRQNSDSAGDILERAKNNVKENEQDELRSGMEAERRDSRDVLTNRQAMPEKESEGGAQLPVQYRDGFELGLVSGESELIRQLNDLMVMGYSGNLTFERDFIAEGVDMLNRFEIQK